MKKSFILILLITLLFSVVALSNQAVLGQGEGNPAPPQVETDDSAALELLYTNSFQLVWDAGTAGGDNIGSYYWPKDVPAEYYVLGHNGQVGREPTGGMYLARELEAGALAAPVGYIPIWKDKDTGGPGNYAFWKPVAPPGYVCLGTVIWNWNPPPLDLISCVRQDLVAPGKVGLSIWNDKGTGSSWSNFGSWHIVPKDENGVYVGAFTGYQSWNPPDDTGLYVLNKERVTIKDSTPNGKYLAIVDVYVENLGTRPGPDYTGVSWAHYNLLPICTVPFIPGETGTFTVPGDINKDIGGDNVFIWVKYDWVAATDNTPVLVDMAVRRWESDDKWNVDCPPGWEAAHGDIGGALTTRADEPCWRNGLCVRYAPMNETETFITNLSLSFPDSEATLPSLCPANGGYWPMKQDDLDIHQGCNDGNWMFLGYSQAKKWPAMPASLPTPSDSEKISALTKYAPLVWQPEDEIYFPSSVEWSFEHLNRVCLPTSFFPPTFNWWLITKESLDSPSDVLPYFHGCDGTSTDIPCDLADTPVYAFWDQVDFKISGEWYGQQVEVYDLIYFMYYPYNRGKELLNTIWGNHVGDWEHVSVRLTPQWDEQNGWSLKPEQVYLSAHDFGRNYLWDEVDKTLGNGIFLPAILGQASAALDDQTIKVEQAGTVDSPFTHPVVYAAWGAHGIWRDPGAHVYQHTPIGILVDHTSQGKPWETWRNVIAFDYDKESGLGGSTWPLWMNKAHNDPSKGDENPASGPIYRWGNTERGCSFGYCRLENGPTGPVDKGVWDVEILR